MREALVVERLDEIVERRAIERLQRKLIECGHEDRRRHLFSADRVDDLETAPARHLHVEKHQVGLEPANLAHGLIAVGCCSDHFDAALPGEGVFDPLTRERLVIGDQHADRFLPGHQTVGILRSRAV